MDDATVMKLTQDRVKLKYQHLITNSFVQCNRLLRSGINYIYIRCYLWLAEKNNTNGIIIVTIKTLRLGTHLLTFQLVENE